MSIINEPVLPGLKIEDVLKHRLKTSKVNIYKAYHIKPIRS